MSPLPHHPCGVSDDLIQTISRRSSEILSEENSGDKILTHLDTTPLMRLHHRHHTHLSSHARAPRRAILTSPSPVCRFCPLTLTVSHALSLYPQVVMFGRGATKSELFHCKCWISRPGPLDVRR